MRSTSPGRTTRATRAPLSPKQRTKTALRRWLPLTAGVGFIVLAALMPLLAIDIPGVFPGPSYTPGTLQLLAFAMVIAALALSYHLLFGLAGMLSFGHTLFFAAGAYGLGTVLRRFAADWLPAGAAFVAAIRQRDASRGCHPRGP
ncbi:MAG: hypothetical protein JWQ59_1191 [Cryobacterium sp.]|nr:hypothetical protein [Cryobacterium sp.]